MKIFIPILFLLAGAVALQAQDLGVTPVDGPVLKADSLQQKPLFLPRVYSPFTEPGVIRTFPFKDIRRVDVIDPLAAQSGK